MPEKELFTSPETAFVKQVSTPSRERATDRVDQGRQTTTPAPQDTPQPSAAPVREVGIAQAIQPPTAPTIRGIAAEAQAAIPDIYKDVREQREKTAAEREKYLKGLPSIEIQGIAAIEQARRERQEALAASREDDNMRRFLAAMRSIGQRTGDYENTLDRIAQREELHRKANLSETEAILKLREAEHQRGLGQFDRADALTKAAMEDIKNLQAARGQAMQSASTLAGNVFQGQSTFAAAQLREQGEERRKAEEIKMRKQELETTRQGTALVAAQGRVDSAQKIYNDAFKEFGFIANMKDADLKNDVMKNQRDEARKILNSIQNEQLNPAIQYRDSLYAKVLGVSPSQSRKPSTEGWGELRVN
jgi:hypothetical protein